MQLAKTRPRTAMLQAKRTSSGAHPPGLEHGCRRPVIERAGRQNRSLLFARHVDLDDVSPSCRFGPVPWRSWAAGDG